MTYLKISKTKKLPQNQKFQKFKKTDKKAPSKNSENLKILRKSF